MAFKFQSSGQDSSDREDMAEINMIPLIDVMLVLLIVFMVAAPLSISGINVNLPTSKVKGSAVSEQTIVLTIDQKGGFYIDKTQIPNEQLTDKMKGIFSVRSDKALYIRADKQVAYGRVIDAMTAAKLAGVGKIAMLTTPPSTAQK